MVGRELDENDHDLLELFFTNVSLDFDNLFLNKGIEDTRRRSSSISPNHGMPLGRIRQPRPARVRVRSLDGPQVRPARRGGGDAQLASTAHDLARSASPIPSSTSPDRFRPRSSRSSRAMSCADTELLSRSTSPIIQTAARIVLLHHERWDGQGYPQGLKEEGINVHGRIVAVADVFDALSKGGCTTTHGTGSRFFRVFPRRERPAFRPMPGRHPAGKTARSSWTSGSYTTTKCGICLSGH
jgi:hypothetical protein